MVLLDTTLLSSEIIIKPTAPSLPSYYLCYLIISSSTTPHSFPTTTRTTTIITKIHSPFEGLSHSLFQYYITPYDDHIHLTHHTRPTIPRVAITANNHAYEEVQRIDNHLHIQYLSWGKRWDGMGWDGIAIVGKPVPGSGSLCCAGREHGIIKNVGVLRSPATIIIAVRGRGRWWELGVVKRAQPPPHPLHHHSH